MTKDLSRDFQDLLKYLTDRRVEFPVVGVHALAFHGVARYTEDLALDSKDRSDLELLRSMVGKLPGDD